MDTRQLVWVFNGSSGKFPSAVFSKKELANAWIKQHKLTGILTAYPVDISIYDWAIDKGYFSPSKDEQTRSEFIGRFSSASQEHYHYEDGKCE